MSGAKSTRVSQARKTVLDIAPRGSGFIFSLGCELCNYITLPKKQMAQHLIQE
jgi:uroporphyrinogen-III decarboxylase